MLTQAAPGCLRKPPYEAAVAAAFPHRHVTTPVPPGFPGAPPAPLCSTAEGPASPAAATPPGAGQAEGYGGHVAERELFVLAAWEAGSQAPAPGLGRAGWQRAEQEDWGQGWLRLSGASGTARSAALQGGTARLRQQPRPPNPRSAPGSRAGSGHSTDTPALLGTKRAAVSQALPGKFGTGICQTPDVSHGSAS